MKQIITDQTTFSRGVLSGSIYRHSNMPRFGFLLTSSEVIQDAATRTLSFIGAFEVIYIPKENDSVYQSFFVSGRLLDVSAGSTKIELKVISPDGELFKANIINANLVAGSVDFYTRFELAEFKKIGRYILKAFVNEVEVNDEGRFFFEVKKSS